jgi:hypothetical protein
MAMTDVQLDQLVPGDVLELAGDLEERIVTATHRCREGRYTWLEYQLEPRGSTRAEYLEVAHEDDEWQISHYAEQLTPEAVGLPPDASFPPALTHDGESYRRLERGSVEITKVGSASPPWQATYADYESGDKRISVEVFQDATNTPRDAEIEVWKGRRIPPHFVKVFALEEVGPRQGLLVAGQRAAPATLARPALPSSLADVSPQTLRIAVAVLAVLLLVIIVAWLL